MAELRDLLLYLSDLLGQSIPRFCNICSIKATMELNTAHSWPPGAMFIAMTNKSVWSQPGSCHNTQKGSFISVPCREMGIKGAMFKNNSAQAAGGALFATYPENVWVDLKVGKN